jgi:hypothetical protein
VSGEIVAESAARMSKVRHIPPFAFLPNGRQLPPKWLGLCGLKP